MCVVVMVWVVYVCSGGGGVGGGVGGVCVWWCRCVVVYVCSGGGVGGVCV